MPARRRSVGCDRERRRRERAGAHPPEAEKASEQARQLGIAGHRRHLVLPEIDEAAGEAIEVGGVGHGPKV
jgi:hypothetical protein